MVVFQVDLFSSTAGEEGTQTEGALPRGPKQLEAEVVQSVATCLTTQPCNIAKR